ncbi:MAG: ferredoxin--NADP reductase [Deltaproteobacteria bacterium]|nr:ferredoxin--NADP reductase [Deltaproteobacteria bacterium]
MIANRLPRSWSATLDQLRRDVVTVKHRLGGRNAPPVVARAPREPGAPAKARVDASARALTVARVVRETNDAVTLVLRDPSGARFDFLPGQFFTLLVDDGGEIVPRNYSASNAPGDVELCVTIKRKPGGRISGKLVGATEGDTVRVLGPFGAFVVRPSPRAARRLVLVAGGAGITPLLSITRAVLATEAASEIVLVYGNRREEDVIFAAELDRLTRDPALGGRLRVVHVLGPLDRATTGRVLGDLSLAHAPDARFYVCGPDPMREEVLAALASFGVSVDRIHVERFTIGPRPQAEPSAAAVAAASAPGARPVSIRVGKELRQATVLPGATLLEAGLAAGVPMPFSCAAGGCGACRVRVVEGDVEVDEPNCLSDAERAAGYVLTCVGRPCGPCTIEVPSEMGIGAALGGARGKGSDS